MGNTPTEQSVIGQFINGRNAQDDFLQLADNHGGTVFAWIDSAGVFHGTFTTGFAAAGSSGQLQFNNAGVFGADSNLTWDNTNKILDVSGTSVLLSAPIAATNVSNQNSPNLKLQGAMWNGAASVEASVVLQNVVGPGVNGGAQLNITGVGANFHGVVISGALNAGTLVTSSILSSQSALAGNITSLTSAGNASAGNTTYLGNFTGIVAQPGMTVIISGFLTGANNGTFIAQAGSSISQVVVNNPSGAAETNPATATYGGLYGGQGTIAFTGSGTGIITVQGSPTSYYTSLASNVGGIAAVINTNGDPNDAGFLQAYSLATTAHGFKIGAIYDGTGANPGFLNWGLNAAGGHILNLQMPDGITGLAATGTLFTSSSVGTAALKASTGSGTASLTISGSTGISTFTGQVIATNLIANAATPTGSAGQLSFGTTTTTSATAGANGDVPAQVVGYITIDIAGTKQKIPYYNV